MTLIDSTFNDNFFSEDEFALLADFMLDSNTSSIQILVNFFDEGIETEYSGGMKVNKAPFALAKTSDVDGAGRDSTLIINGITYYITEALPDGTGITSLQLSKQAL